ncbi:YceI family protein [Flavobacterium piscis]|uniref:Polyisoprenoid-binding protein YceI n=1 Tax=Flavobacterium piscis TaxID=1114874 RepID=A0ABU1Y7T6_9FLAO|nr:YceI family protein [Flavobacterium piscis]MDR7210297.1 polyisoprenoid-binding protein YceI [Flavobacterium piscis]
MNNKLTITYLILIIAPFFFGCRGPVKEENKNNAPASSLSLHVGNEKYVVIDTKESTVIWKGSNLIGSNSHTGYVYISKGELIIENGQLMGGTVEVDMNTIEDENHGRNSGLVNHLKDPDFFDVKKFPFSTIVLTKAASINGENKKVAGNLTIKGITHPVIFPAKMEVKEGIVKVKGKLVIDRTKWNVRYKSGKFYDLLADQTISDSIEFHIKIVAKK